MGSLADRQLGIAWLPLNGRTWVVAVRPLLGDRTREQTKAQCDHSRLGEPRFVSRPKQPWLEEAL